MLLEIFGFLKFSITDFLDILLVTLIIYTLFRWIRDTTTMNIFIALLSIYVIKVLADAFNMKLLSALIGTFIDVGVLAVIIIFQPEIRRFLMRFGSGARMGARGKALINRILGNEDKALNNEAVNEITEACRRMAEHKTGALIVLPHENRIDHIIETGDRIDAAIHRRLIMNLFFKNSPLHDGAVIIMDNHIVAARCTLPITERTDIPPQYGMRHKAAIGITEETDADAIVVSEETGEITFGRRGQLQVINNINELKLLLNSSLSKQAEER